MIRYERRKLAELKPDPDNPRTISARAKGALAASIRRFGLVQPIVINETTGHVVGGHQRLDVLREQGVIETDVAIGQWTEQEERVLSVALNNPGAQGEFTNVKQYLAGALKALSLDDFQELRLDSLVLMESSESKRRESKALEYKLVVACRDEDHQTDLLERFEAEGLSVKLLIV